MADGVVEAVARWYVMLVPGRAGARAYARLASEVARRVGGVPGPPHLTVAYLEGEADAAAVASSLAAVPARPTPVLARGLFGFSDQPDALFGYALYMPAAKHAGLRRLHDAVLEALRPTGLKPVFGWQKLRPHMRLVASMPQPPSEALRRLGSFAAALRFTGATVWATRLADGHFHDVLERPLDGTTG